MAGRGRRHELRRGGGLSAGEAAFDRLAGMGDQRPVDHRMDRAAEPDELGAAGRVGRLREAAEERPGAAVVEQDAALEVADDDALLQLGHQRAKLVALERHLPARLVDQPGHVGAEGLALVGERVHRGRDRAEGGAPRGRQRRRGGIAGKEPRGVREAGRRADEGVVQAGGGPGAEGGSGEPEAEDDRPVARDERRERRALVRVERGADEEAGQPEPGRQRGARREEHEHPAPVELHATISRTFATRSRVEKGLVM